MWLWPPIIVQSWTIGKNCITNKDCVYKYIIYIYVCVGTRMIRLEMPFNVHPFIIISLFQGQSSFIATWSLGVSLDQRCPETETMWIQVIWSFRKMWDWLILIDVDWCCLILIDIDWYCLILMMITQILYYWLFLHTFFLKSPEYEPTSGFWLTILQYYSLSRYEVMWWH